MTDKDKKQETHSRFYTITGALWVNFLPENKHLTN